MAENWFPITMGFFVGVLLYRLIPVVWYGLDALSLWMRYQRDIWHNRALIAKRERR